MYKIKILLLLSIMFGAGSAFPNNGTPDGPLANNDAGAFSCSLPAPASIAIIAKSTNSLTVQWAAVPGAIAYDVTAYDVITMLPYPVLPTFPSAVSAVVAPLPAGVEVEVRVAPICANGEKSGNHIAVRGFTDIVIDIVANGRACEGRWDFSAVGTGNNTDIQVTMSKNLEYYCEVVEYASSQRSTFSLNTSSMNNHAAFAPVYTNIGQFSADATGTFAYLRNTANVSICNFNISGASTSQVVLHVLNLPSTHGFNLRYCGDGGKGGAGNRSDMVAADDTPEWTISPNPFTDLLTIHLPEAADGDARVTLLQINGAVVESQKVPMTGNAVCDFNTASLPAGMYLVRTETPGGSQTRLVSKI